MQCISFGLCSSLLWHDPSPPPALHLPLLSTHSVLLFTSLLMRWYQSLGPHQWLVTHYSHERRPDSPTEIEKQQPHIRHGGRKWCSTPLLAAAVSSSSSGESSRSSPMAESCSSMSSPFFFFFFKNLKDAP